MITIIRFLYNFLSFSDARLLAAANAAVVRLTGNFFFPVLDPTLAEIQTKIDAFSTLVSEAKSGDRLKIAQKNAAKQDLLDILCLMVANLTYACKGNFGSRPEHGPGPCQAAAAGRANGQAPELYHREHQPERLCVLERGQAARRR